MNNPVYGLVSEGMSDGRITAKQPASTVISNFADEVPYMNYEALQRSFDLTKADGEQ